VPRHHRIFEYEGHWLVRRSDTPNYHIYWCRPGTRRVRRKSTGTGDLDKAKRRLIRLARQRATPSRRTPEEVSLLECLNDYVERDMAGRPTEALARSTLRSFLAFFDLHAIETVAELTYDMQGEYIDWRRRSAERAGRTLSNGTIARELSVLKAALRNAWKRGRLSEAPYIRSLPPPPPRDRFLTREEFQRLYAHCREPHLRLYVLMATHTMQRPSAILGLRTEQVDLAHGLIDFLPPGEIQSNKRRPVIPISDTLLPLLTEACANSKTGYVLEYQGRRVLSVKKSFKSACQSAGLTGVTPYTLRHTGATLAVAAGVPIREVSGMLGHSHTRTTEIYAKRRPEFLRHAKSAVDEIFQPPKMLPAPRHEEP
jgi:integrase